VKKILEDVPVVKEKTPEEKKQLKINSMSRHRPPLQMLKKQLQRLHPRRLLLGIRPTKK